MKAVILQKPCYVNIYVDIFIILKNELKNPEKLIVRFCFKTSLSSNSCSPFCPSLYYPSFLYTLPTLNVFLTLFMTSTVELRSQTWYENSIYKEAKNYTLEKRPIFGFTTLWGLKNVWKHKEVLKIQFL